MTALEAFTVLAARRGVPLPPALLRPAHFQGSPLWWRLHTFARGWDGDIRAARDHLAQLDAALPECCQPHWRGLLATHPPDLRDADAFFEWTVDRHNDVNRRLGRPALPLAAAAEMYGPVDPAL